MRDSSFSFFGRFFGNCVTPILTLAHNKRSYSETWKISGQNENCVLSRRDAVLDFRE